MGWVDGGTDEQDRVHCTATHPQPVQPWVPSAWPERCGSSAGEPLGPLPSGRVGGRLPATLCNRSGSGRGGHGPSWPGEAEWSWGGRRRSKLAISFEGRSGPSARSPSPDTAGAGGSGEGVRGSGRCATTKAGGARPSLDGRGGVGGPARRHAPWAGLQCPGMVWTSHPSLSPSVPPSLLDLLQKTPLISAPGVPDKLLSPYPTTLGNPNWGCTFCASRFLLP